MVAFISSLCVAATAAPLANVLGLCVAIWTGQCTYPYYTISDVIRTTPGLNVVAAGWQIFAASFAVLSYMQDRDLARVSEWVPA